MNTRFDCLVKGVQGFAIVCEEEMDSESETNMSKKLKDVERKDGGRCVTKILIKTSPHMEGLEKLGDGARILLQPNEYHIRFGQQDTIIVHESHE